MRFTAEGFSLLFILQTVLAVFFPILVGLVTTRVTAARVQALLLLALNLLATLIANVVEALNRGDAEFNLGMALVEFVLALVVSIALHYGLWKPTGATDKALDSGRHAY